MKLRRFEISGIRGIRENLSLSLDPSKSVLIYGENGSGKSSITDAIEWFYYDSVEHLSSEEIGRKGIDALRNLFLPDEDAAYIDLKFSDSTIDSQKRLFYKKSKIVSEYSNETKEFADYVKTSSAENLILRYRDLLKFILFSKDEKLREISDIIGFSEVTKVKDILKKAVNGLKKDLKIKSFDAQINTKQSVIIEQIGQNIHTDDQYFQAISLLVKPLNLSAEIKDPSDTDKILELIRTPGDDETIRLQLSYEKVIAVLMNLSDLNKTILSTYAEYYEKYEGILKDIEKYKKISLEKLLTEALSILEKNLFDEDLCPLCLQVKSREGLIAELKQRVQELANFKKEKDQLEELRSTSANIIEVALGNIDTALREKCIELKENTEIKNEINNLKKSYSDSLHGLKNTTRDVAQEIIKPDGFLKYDLSILQKLISAVKGLRDQVLSAKKDDLKFSINNKLVLVKAAYDDIKRLKREKAVLDQQLRSFEVIFTEFIKKQKDSLSAFLNAISHDINELYIYMNASENVDEIELVPMEKDGELVGVTIQFKFHSTIVSPPNKYLSESHLNCLGICLFLSSVKAFNQVNKFIIFDDVISSFDSAHRIRFANLLAEKFTDYQMLVLTHERDWFSYFSNMVKGKNWIVNRTKWDSTRGARLEIPLIELKERIEHKFANSDSHDLGNMMRKYLERLLKEVCFNLEVKVRFLYNDENEGRMSHELLSELRGKLKQRKCEIKDAAALGRISASMFIGNKASHDNSFEEKLADLKVLYDDILELESIFTCVSCGKQISKRYLDNVEKKIRCKCGDKKYTWEK